ncbi:hypothetical protein DXG03_008341, partial [Asterophora parasitica]
RTLSALRIARATNQLYTPRAFSSRTYTTRTIPPDEEPVNSNETNEGEAKHDSEASWISILENTTSAPWLYKFSPVPSERLQVAYTLLFQIVLYLTRPGETEQFLVVSCCFFSFPALSINQIIFGILQAFHTAPAPDDSEIGRARKAIGTILKAAVAQISSVPVNSPLRTDHTEVFDIFGALQVIHDTYLVDDEIVDLKAWSEFWGRTQPVVLELGMKLDEKGFGWNEEDLQYLTTRKEGAEATSEGDAEKKATEAEEKKEEKN